MFILQSNLYHARKIKAQETVGHPTPYALHVPENSLVYNFSNTNDHEADR